jgi:hypothetical protein
MRTVCRKVHIIQYIYIYIYILTTAVYNDDTIHCAATQIHLHTTHDYDDDDDDDDDDNDDDDDDDNNVQCTRNFILYKHSNGGKLNYYDYRICMLYVCGFV